VMRGRRAGPAPGPGDRILARLSRIADGDYEARIIRHLGGAPRRLLAMFERGPHGARLLPVDRRDRHELAVPKGSEGGAEPGELVEARLLRGRRLGLREAEVTRRIGRADAPGSASLIAIHRHEIPVDFPAEALEETAAAVPATMDHREDIRALPLITIDDADARDFDDAVFAEADPDADNPGGWHLIVAIADVAWYVRPGSALDEAARARGNSVYFPDRVVPMLPERLSNDLCSLRPGEDRPCVFVHIWIDSEGRKRRHFFARGLMRSAARLTYLQVQNARDGRPDSDTAPLAETTLAALFGAYDSLRKARHDRGTLDLDLPERRILFADDGRVAAIEPRSRYDSHRLIEEFMVGANICAAETLEHHRHPCMYRVHEEPAPAKIEVLRDFLDSLGHRFARDQRPRPSHFTALLHKVEGTPHAPAVNQAILRAQSRAAYSPENLGHFGLALERYGHFTSPIRRYADLLVHRALIRALDAGPGGLPKDADETFAETGVHISETERRATAAERETMDRYVAAFMADRVGARFAGRVSGVTRAGLFVALDETGADGLVPLGTMRDDYYRFDEKAQALVGRHTHRRYRMGDEVRVRLKEAIPLTGGMIFTLDGAEGEPGDAPEKSSRPHPPRAGARKGKPKRTKRRKR
ncbi:MAG: ribonuclease R, partial [Alphaproteobacteria bacterium]